MRIYDEFRFDLLQKAIHGFDYLSLETIHPNIKEGRIVQALEKKKSNAIDFLTLNFSSFIKELNTFFERYLDEQIINKSEEEEGTVEEEYR